MLHHLPAPLHVAALRLAHAVRRRWWRLSRRLGASPIRGCRVLVLDREERVLLIRHSYGERHWTLPGGGLGRREDVLAAASREVREECACRLADPVLLGLAGEAPRDGLHEVHLVAGWTSDVAVADRREIAAAAFFAADNLPEGVSARLAGRLPDYLTRARAARPARP